MKPINEIDCAGNLEFPICDPNLLVNLRDISIDNTKSVMERIGSFLNQVTNPYLLRVDDIVIKVNYHGERALTDALSTVLLMG